MTLTQTWPQIRALFKEALKTSLHHAVASVDAQGNPHITPIGSLYLHHEPKGTYFEIFTRKLPTHLTTHQRVCVMAVPSSFRLWFHALRRGRFPRPPGVRLYGTVGERRAPTPEETARIRRRFRFARFLKGHDILWKELHHVRDITFDDWAPINIGSTTRGLWREGKPR